MAATRRQKLSIDYACTQEQLAVELGISRARVMQLEARALKKLRDAVMADPSLRARAIELFGEAILRGEKRK